MHNIRRKFVFVKNFFAENQKTSEISSFGSLLFYLYFVKYIRGLL